VIKYLGSKRRLAPLVGAIAEAAGVRTALDLFSGTTRVAQELKRRAVEVTAVDTARYTEVFARCYIATDARDITAAEHRRLEAVIAALDRLPGRAGYVTETFCRRSRFFQPFNGERIDAIRSAIERDWRADPWFPVLLTSLIEAADRVDSTTGVQMAYVKRWSSRSFKPLSLKVPVLLDGSGRAIRGDACDVVAGPGLGRFDMAYLDPPYNQHRYSANYHIWETLVAWDAPDHYGVACKRADLRDAGGRSRFNLKREMPRAMAEIVERVPADLVVLSYNDESWIGIDDLVALCARRGTVEVLAFDSPRYVGARIGIYDPSGKPVGRPSRLRNVEYLVITGPADRVAVAAQAARSEATAQTVATSPMPAMSSVRPSGARVSSPS
jgi:adenine-specific DNA-methyltransferase